VSWFIAIVAGMTIAALAWILRPLLRRSAQPGGIERAATNLAVLRDEVAELDRDLTEGTLAPEQHARSRAELERRVLEEAATEERGAGAGVRTGGRRTAASVGVLLPVAAVALYVALGNPEGLTPRDEGHGGPNVTPQQVEQMVSRLAAKLEANPEDAQGWMLLGRSYLVIGRFPEAVKAYAKAAEIVKDDPDLYADYADAVAMTQDRRIDGEARKLVERALKLEPNHVKALALAATGAMQRNDRKAARTYLARLQAQAAPDSEIGRMVTGMLSDLGDDGKAPVAAKAPAAGADVSGRVTLSGSLAGKAAPSDTVFILARATEGPRMPLAILKRQVKDLPMDFELTDEQSMSPQMKLSNFREVVVVARVSKSGSATPQSGDLQGSTGTVKVGAGNVSVLIDAVVP